MLTKLLGPLAKRWRNRGIRAIVYIDDGIVASSSKERNVSDRNVVVTDIKRVGFVLKSKLDPQQLAKRLGFNKNLSEGNFYVPEDQVDNLKSAKKQASLHPN